MFAQRLCQSCGEPRPRAAVRCPWCLTGYSLPPRAPEHLFAAPDGKQGQANEPPQHTSSLPGQ